jgi:hypothetical protein
MMISCDGKLQKIRATAYSGFEGPARKCCCATMEPVGAICIHLYGAAIHSTSFTQLCDLRCGEAVDRVNRSAPA